MPSLAKHPLGWHYIYLRLIVGFLRLLTALAQRRSTKQLDEGIAFQSITVPSRDKERNIKVHLHRPEGYDSTKPTPVLVNWHGSSFIIPMFGANREFCSLIATRTKCLVFDADYRKAPEHPFPAAIQDAEDIVYYLIANPDKYDPSNIFLSGFSAGGSIALVTASTLGPDRIKGVIGFYPAVDLTKQHTAPEKRMLAGVIVPPFFRNIARAAYMLSRQPRDDPRISVIHAPTENFPKHIYLVCGNADAGYDPLVKFTERLKEAGHRDIEFVSLVYMGHGFDARAKKGTEAEKNKLKTYAGAVGLINRVIGASR